MSRWLRCGVWCCWARGSGGAAGRSEKAGRAWPRPDKDPFLESGFTSLCSRGLPRERWCCQGLLVLLRWRFINQKKCSTSRNALKAQVAK